MRSASERGQDLGLSDDEIAFYDTLEVNDSAVQVLGDGCLRIIAQELVRSARESARARIRVLVRRILRKHGYPLDKQERATQLVLQQAEVLCGEWSGE